MVSNLLKNGRLLATRRQTNILSAAFVIMVAYAASGILGLVRNRMLAATFFGGRESELDAYFAAFVIPDTLFQLLIIGALSAAFIPVFSHYLKRDEQEASKLASASINVITLVFLALVIIVFMLSGSLSRLIAPSLDPGSIILLSRLLRIMLLAQVFFALSGFMTAIIQAHQRFLIPALAPIAYNLGIVGGIVFLTPTYGIFGPAVGVVVGAVLHFVIQIPLASRLGFQYSFNFNINHPGVREIRKLMPLRSLTLAVGQAERFIAVFIATALAAGSLTIFNFARQLYLLPVTLFGTTIGQASFPSLSADIAAEKKEEFAKTLRSSLLQTLFLSLPAAAIVLILRLPAVRIAFGARNFPWEATLLTGKTVALLAIAIPTQSLIGVLIRAFYALHDTKTPFLTTSGSAALTVMLSIIFAETLELGVIGLGVAVAISTLVHTLILLFLMHKKTAIISAQFIIGVVKMMLATAIMGVFLWIPMRVIDRYILDTTRTLNLLLLTMSVLAIGILVYINLSSLMRIEQLSEVFALGRRIGNWRRALEESEEVLETTSEEKPTG
ncbi:MAG: murein biosynthesis integral membrane protein MurJ [Candidatus Chisholmbacteria bacterium RIFCSPHIGHO2_01_FULL_49_18]|uniref:Probable lipid II flippase MurJ n=1 Tax=Candidatus Chisholmbacteria bacterium RIFCSPHIGHO2_01_FULL_49_18 TaxID=1797590 RepID=A0A1G1VKZ2_9BACT|nr:MAG: murein biosynthesis integral membrane protein MurJ [Candidatus Chisholmbacteria bacterium RIFCSPHIGHO2_01_FULL_49_18]